MGPVNRDPATAAPGDGSNGQAAAPAAMAAAMAGIWEQCKGIIEGQVTVVERAAIAVLDGSLEEDLRQQAYRDAHKLAGSLGTFGLAEASEFAREIELLLEVGVRDGAGAADPGNVLRLSELAVALRRQFDGGLPQ